MFRRMTVAIELFRFALVNIVNLSFKVQFKNTSNRYVYFFLREGGNKKRKNATVGSKRWCVNVVTKMLTNERAREHLSAG